MCSKVIMGKRRIGLWPALVSLAIMVGGAGATLGQIQVRGGGSARQTVGIPRSPDPGGVPGLLSNRIVSGNVGAGKSFRGSGAIGNFRTFQGSLPTSSLSGFLRDSYGLSNNASNMGIPKSFFLPSSTVLGIRGITSGRARPGSNMPANVSLTPKTPGGLVSEGRGRSLRDGGSGTVDRRLDLRATGRGLPTVAMDPTIERANNLLGIQRMTPELGLERPYEEVVKEIAAKRRAEEGTERRSVEPSFQALPAWAQPVIEAGEGEEEIEAVLPELIGQPRDMTQSIEENLAKSKEVLEESQGKLGVAGIVDIYERMKAEAAAREQGEEVTTEEEPDAMRLPELYLGEDEEKLQQQGLLEGMQVYNTFVSRRWTSFNEYMARGEALLKTGYYYQALRAYDGAIGLQAMNPLGHLGRAYSLAGAGELISASQSLGRALAIFPEQAWTKIELKSFFANQEEIDRITGKLSRLAEFQKGDARVRLLLGYIYHYSGRRDLAGPILQEAAELAKTDKSVPADLAEIIGKFSKAVSKR